MSKLKVFDVYLFHAGGTKVYLKSEVDRLLDQKGVSRFTEFEEKPPIKKQQPTVRYKRSFR